MLDLIKKNPAFGPDRKSLYTPYRRVYRPSKQWSQAGYMKPVLANQTQANGFREYPIKPANPNYVPSTRAARRRAALGRV